MEEEFEEDVVFDEEDEDIFEANIAKGDDFLSNRIEEESNPNPLL